MVDGGMGEGEKFPLLASNLSARSMLHLGTSTSYIIYSEHLITVLITW